MIRDFLNKHRIDEKGRKIADVIVVRYPPDIDEKKMDGARKRSAPRKAGMKLEKAVQAAREEIGRVNDSLRLGVYGKARLYKMLQSELFNKGYNENTVRLFMERIISSHY